MSEFRERQRLSGLSMRKVSFYMEYIAKAESTDQASVTRHTSRRTERGAASSRQTREDISRAGIPDPWDVAPAPAKPQSRNQPAQQATSVYQLGSFYDDVQGGDAIEPPMAQPRRAPDPSGMPAQPEPTLEAPLDLDAPIDWGAAYDTGALEMRAPSKSIQTEQAAPPPASDLRSGSDQWSFGAGQWKDFISADTGGGVPIEEPEGMRLDFIGTQDSILTEDELRRAMAFLNDDAFLVTGVGVSESARRSIEATSKIKPLTPDMLEFDLSAKPAPAAQPAEQPPVIDDEPFEIIDEEALQTKGRVIPRTERDDDFDSDVYERPVRERSGLRVLIVVLLALFLLSAGAVAYLWFFTDLLPFGTQVVDAHEVYLGNESVGCVIDGPAVQAAIEADRIAAQDQTGLAAEHSLPIRLIERKVEKRFVATEEEMIEYIRNRTAILVQAAGVYLDGRLIGAVWDEQVLEKVMEEALAPFLSLVEKRELLSLGFVEKLEARPLLVKPDALMEQEELNSKLIGPAPFEQAPLYEVTQGDSLSAIARRNDIPVSQLRYANPELIGQDLITPGMRLRIEPPSSLLTVEFTERVRAETSIPYETETKTSSRLYTTQKETEQKGVNGVREILADRRYVAGVLVEETILEETVIREAVTEIIVKGTKKASGSSSGSSKYITPVKGKVSSRFGTRWGSTHYGLDFSASTGTPIYAARDGTVTFSGTNSSYGKLVKIDHGGGVETRYAHCSSLKVKKGDKVKQGDLIALVGSTGRSTGPHLHFEIRIDGKAKDPEKYL